LHNYKAVRSATYGRPGAVYIDLAAEMVNATVESGSLWYEFQKPNRKLFKQNNLKHSFQIKVKLPSVKNHQDRLHLKTK